MGIWPIRYEIADAIKVGLGTGHYATGYGGKGKVKVWVRGHDEPIVVMDDDVIIPDDLSALAPGIRLDVQAILASR